MSGEEPDYVTPTREMLRRRLQAMAPERFEHFVADLWQYFGWDTRVVGQPGDRGIDVIATTDAGAKQLIQAKRYGPDTTVGSPEVQQYSALRLQEDDVDTVTIVTTGSFSRQAESIAPELDVTLVDGEELLDLVEHRDAWALVAEYFGDVEIATAVEAEPDRPERSGILARVRSVLGL